MPTKQQTNHIPTEQYNQITELMPIASVEAVIQIDDALLFLKRNNQPVKGEWWFPGGRIKKGEPQLTDAIQKLIEWNKEVYAIKLDKTYKRIDIGTPQAYKQALETTYQN